MNPAFFIVGPTAAGKSAVAADVASRLNAEIVSADAFQIYAGLDLLSAKPDPVTLRKARHHLVGAVSIEEKMDAEKFRRLASGAIADIRSRRKWPLVVGGSGLYIKAMTHGLSPLPTGNAELRAELNDLTLEELRSRLIRLDAKAIDAVDVKNRRRVVRALEICLLTGKPASGQRDEWNSSSVEAAVPGRETLVAETAAAVGVFVFREREELYERINQRVQGMFEKGVIEEVRALGSIGVTAAKTIGLSEIRELLDRRVSIAQCVAQIQQATRRYAKRQLTWFRRQTNFEPLNLSLLSHEQAVEWITERARRSFA